MKITPLPPQILPDGREAAVLRLETAALAVTVTNYGARITDLRLGGVPVVLGHDAVADYLDEPGYLGATVGRFANRIAGGRFRIDGEHFTVPANNGPHALHGGPVGFDRAVWRILSADEAGLALGHLSPAGDQGFPGTLRVVARFAIEGRTLALDYEAETDRATVINLTNHAYFNLAGEDSGEVLDHRLELAADAMLPVDATLIPTGVLRPVAGTAFDFRTPRRIGERIDASDEQLRHGRGYDHCFVLRDAPAPGEARFAARLTAPDGTRSLEVWTTEPGVQFYSGNVLGAQRARRGGVVTPRAGLCLETQHFPDSPNQAAFPSTILRPGTRFRSRTIWRFSDTDPSDRVS